MIIRSSTMAAKFNQRGQALVEFIVFLPFMLMMYTVVVSLGDAIHGSINQQKAARAYLYFRLQNNSQISKPQQNASGNTANSLQFIGHNFIGWSDYLEGEEPVHPCYKLNLPFAPAADDTCEEPYDSVTTQFIRVGTVYGLCGASMEKIDNGFVEQPSNFQVNTVVDTGSCWIR